ncbi:MAG: zinc ABC transporter substrate-binding protein [Lentisphaeria bacterium]|nr:zinc ABC transporter substrate-binding protein [Lentisphaeria bacterium]
MNGSRRVILAVLLLAAVSGVGGEPLSVVVSVVPQLESVRRIGADLVQVEALVPAGASPETYVMNARRMAMLSRSSVLFRIGAPMEQALLPKLSRTQPDLDVIDTRKGMRLLTMAATGHVHGHVHGHDGHGHGEEEMDPHVWLSPANMTAHARTVGAVLAERLPEHAADIRERTERYVRDLGELDGRLRTRLRPLAGSAIVVFHPAFGYFLEAYGIAQIAVEVGGRTPSGRQLGQVLSQARRAGVRAVYVQPQFNRKAAQAVADELQCPLRVLDPLPEAYLSGLEAMGEALLRP